MKKITHYLLALLLLTTFVACESDDATEPSEEAEVTEAASDEATEPEAEAPSEIELRAQTLAALASSIEAEPDRVDELLAEANMTEEELETAIFEISADPEGRAAFQAAR